MQQRTPTGGPRRAAHSRQPAVTPVLAWAVVAACTVGTASAATGAAGCAALKGTAIRNTTITATQYVTAPMGNYCEVAATVAPQHDVRIRLPDHWQRRYVQYGGGGFDGTIPDLSTGFGTSGRDPVGSGFVVAASNGGHRSSEYPGASFAADRGLTLSYSVAKIYDTDLVARALMQAYYQQQPHYRYFTGCSNGGKNASVAASNYFQHYDGVIGAAGVWGHHDDDVGGADMPGLTAKWVQTVQVGALTQAKGAALRARITQTCDPLDGAKDGIVANVQACPFMQVASSLRCSGADTGSCLTDADLAKVKAHINHYVVGNEVRGPAWSATTDLSSVAASSEALSSGFLAMALRSSSAIDPAGFDLVNGFDEVKTVLDDLYSMTGDLDGIRKYLARDKKLILYHGWDDNVVPAYGSINFYRALRQADPQGSRNVRLYMGPGVGHCRGGHGADSQELLHVMARWVEQNAEPGAPANPALSWKRGDNAPADLSGAAFSRPLCAFPEYPAYRGQGDPRLATSYLCRPGALHEIIHSTR